MTPEQQAKLFEGVQPGRVLPSAPSAERLFAAIAARVRYDFDYFGVGSVEQPIDGRSPFRSFRRRNDPAVGPDHGLAPRPPSRGVRPRKVRPRNAGVSGRRSGRRVKPALASTPRNAKRGDKRAHSSNPGKA
jgi:hypothetical protein